MCGKKAKKKRASKRPKPSHNNTSKLSERDSQPEAPKTTVSERKITSTHIIRERRNLLAFDLAGLPLELIGLIADHLTLGDLCALRRQHNRLIMGAIDLAFATIGFSCQVCRTTRAGLSRFTTISTSRFAKRIRTLEIHIDVACIFGGRLCPVNGAVCTKAAFSGFEISSWFSALFLRLSNLKSIMIRAPSDHSDSISNGLASEAPSSHNGLSLSAIKSTFSVGHNHTVNVASYQTLLNGLVHTVRLQLPQLEQFSIMNFSNSLWQSRLARTPSILREMTRDSGLQAMTTLNLQLNMCTHTTGSILAQVGELIGKNPNLKVLKLCAGPNMRSRHRTYNKNWAALLETLGSDPPFRLHTLEIDGLVTNTNAPTLDRIVEVHSPNLRRLVLQHTNFCHPNTLWAFFNALANSEVRYYAWKLFLVHQTGYLAHSTLMCLIVPDEVLTPSYKPELLPELDKDWVYIAWGTVGQDDLSVWDDNDGSLGDGGIKAAFRDVDMAIKCGSIEGR